MTALPAMLGFALFYDPLTGVFSGMSDYWLWLVVPLVAAISIVYKCTRITSLRTLPKEALVMSAQILVVMLAAAVILGAGFYAVIRIIGHWG